MFTLVSTNCPTAHSAQSSQRADHDEDISGDFLPLGAGLVSCWGRIRCPSRIDSFWGAFFPLLLAIHWLGCAAPEFGVSGRRPTGIWRGFTGVYVQADYGRGICNKIIEVKECLSRNNRGPGNGRLSHFSLRVIRRNFRDQILLESFLLHLSIRNRSNRGGNAAKNRADERLWRSEFQRAGLSQSHPTGRGGPLESKT